MGSHPSTRHIRGSNFCHIGVVEDRISGRVVVLAALDNLTKGSSGQALQNANLMLGCDETTGSDDAAGVSIMRGLKKQRRIQVIVLALVCLTGRDRVDRLCTARRDQPVSLADTGGEAAPAPGEVFRLGGLVAQGSIRKGEGVHFYFDITDGANTVAVKYIGTDLPPDLFEEGQGTIATGRFADGLFEATEILAKHDETYMPKEVIDALKEQGVYQGGEGS